jgi:hypothetical protein
MSIKVSFGLAMLPIFSAIFSMTSTRSCWTPLDDDAAAACRRNSAFSEERRWISGIIACIWPCISCICCSIPCTVNHRVELVQGVAVPVECAFELSSPDGLCSSSLTSGLLAPAAVWVPTHAVLAELPASTVYPRSCPRVPDAGPLPALTLP